MSNRRSIGGPYLTRVIAGQVSRITRYYDALVQFKPLSNDDGTLLHYVECADKVTAARLEEIPEQFADVAGKRTAVLLNGNLNHDLDIEATLSRLKTRLNRLSRVIVVLYNPYFSGSTLVTRKSLAALAALSGYQIVQVKPIGYVRFRLFGLGDLINRLLPIVPLVRWCGAATVVVLRPVAGSTPPSLSIVIPCRNERGNVEEALTRLPSFPAPVEVIFVEGQSSDGTWEEVQRVVGAAGARFKRFKLAAYQQSGQGRSDAVRLGLSKATCELVTVLDANLTLPPELLTRFYNAYCDGLADFINGTRLVYPMEGEATWFLDRLGHAVFARVLSSVLDAHVTDALCGTKLFRRDDYARMARWRQDCGDVDELGDFELLFPASILGLGIIDVPISYRVRQYGASHVIGFRHRWWLLRMLLMGVFRVKAGAAPRL